MNNRNELENALAYLDGRQDTSHPFVAAFEAVNGEAGWHPEVLDALDVAGIDVADLPTYEDWYLDEDECRERAKLPEDADYAAWCDWAVNECGRIIDGAKERIRDQLAEMDASRRVPPEGAAGRPHIWTMAEVRDDLKEIGGKIVVQSSTAGKVCAAVFPSDEESPETEEAFFDIRTDWDGPCGPSRHCDDEAEEIANILTRRYPTTRGAWQYDSANGIIEQVV